MTTEISMQKSQTKGSAFRSNDRARQPPSFGRVLVWLVLAMGACLSLAPIIFMIRTSFGTAGTFSVDGWAKVIKEGILQAGWNSLLLCLLSVALSTIVVTLASFAFAKLRFRGSQALLMTVLVLMLVPSQVYIIPQYFNIANLSLVGNIPTTAVIYAATQLPFSIFVMTNFFRSIPDELLEATIVDGASYPRALLSVFLPMSVPPLVTIGVLNFIGVWNDLLIALLYLPSGEQRTIGVVIATAGSLRVYDVTMVMAGALLSAIPCLIVYIVFQRYITVGLTAGIGK